MCFVKLNAEIKMGHLICLALQSSKTHLLSTVWQSTTLAGTATPLSHCPRDSGIAVYSDFIVALKLYNIDAHILDFINGKHRLFSSQKCSVSTLYLIVCVENAAYAKPGVAVDLVYYLSLIIQMKLTRFKAKTQSVIRQIKL